MVAVAEYSGPAPHFYDGELCEQKGISPGGSTYSSWGRGISDCASESRLGTNKRQSLIASTVKISLRLIKLESPSEELEAELAADPSDDDPLYNKRGILRLELEEMGRSSRKMQRARERIQAHSTREENLKGPPKHASLTLAE